MTQSAERDRLKHQRDVLAQAIADTVLAFGIWNGETQPNGPELLLMLEDTVGERDRLMEMNARLTIFVDLVADLEPEPGLSGATLSHLKKLARDLLSKIKEPTS